MGHVGECRGMRPLKQESGANSKQGNQEQELPLSRGLTIQASAFAVATPILATNLLPGVTDS